MWSPWRSRYIQSFTKPTGKRKKGETLFTAALKGKDDEKNLIVWRGEHCFVIMNRYPYNNGHLMIVPNRKVSDFQKLRKNEMLEVMETTQRVLAALDEVMRPHGYNFGANIGRVSGAGVRDHLHFHVVPRWNGDTNFMPVLAETKVISEDIQVTLKKIRKFFKKTKKKG
jgi:ATP adenylyltransferase